MVLARSLFNLSEIMSADKLSIEMVPAQSWGQNLRQMLTRDKYQEAHDMIMKAWAEDEPFAFDGKYNQLRYVNCWPRPIQKPHPPIWM